MRTLDFSPLFRSTVGFDRLASMLDTATRLDEQTPAYPPYNIEKLGDDAYRITMAVAGFGHEDLSAEVNGNMLTITGKHETEQGEGKKYLHHGIAARAFERKFQLADHVKIVSAELKHGLLNLDLAREIPEAMKPRRIEILTGANDHSIIEGKAA